MKKEDHNAVPDSVLTKEFLSQFKTEDDVSKFLTKLHAQVLEKMLEGEMDVHLGYEKNSIADTDMRCAPDTQLLQICGLQGQERVYG